MSLTRLSDAELRRLVVGAAWMRDRFVARGDHTIAETVNEWMIDLDDFRVERGTRRRADARRAPLLVEMAFAGLTEDEQLAELATFDADLADTDWETE